MNKFDLIERERDERLHLAISPSTKKRTGNNEAAAPRPVPPLPFSHHRSISYGSQIVDHHTIDGRDGMRAGPNPNPALSRIFLMTSS